MHAVSTNQIADILDFNDNWSYPNFISEKTTLLYFKFFSISVCFFDSQIPEVRFNTTNPLNYVVEKKKL